VVRSGVQRRAACTAGRACRATRCRGLSAQPPAATRPTAASPSYLCPRPRPQQQQAPPSGPPTVVVFGGRGFVGSAVCEEALKMGLEVISLTPSGGF
jgi:NADPH:quinone reductase-like Zn-dependent oxidoreductase